VQRDPQRCEQKKGIRIIISYSTEVSYGSGRANEGGEFSDTRRVVDEGGSDGGDYHPTFCPYPLAEMLSSRARPPAPTPPHTACRRETVRVAQRLHCARLTIADRQAATPRSGPPKSSAATPTGWTAPARLLLAECAIACRQSVPVALGQTKRAAGSAGPGDVPCRRSLPGRDLPQSPGLDDGVS
jgi:hypothetical protein